MTLKKLLLVISGAVGILGSFLPWYKASVSFFGYSQSTSMNAFQMSALYIILAILMILASVAVILLAALDEKQIKKMVKIKDALKTTMIVGIVMAVITLIAFIAIQSEAKGFGGVSWGIWLMILASVATIVLSALKNKELDKVVAGKGSETKKSETKKK